MKKVIVHLTYEIDVDEDEELLEIDGDSIGEIISGDSSCELINRLRELDEPARIEYEEDGKIIQEKIIKINF